MQGPTGLSVGQIIHLNGMNVDPDSGAVLPGEVCVAAIVTQIDGDDLYTTAFNSPNTASNGFQPYTASWHWPEQA